MTTSVQAPAAAGGQARMANFDPGVAQALQNNQALADFIEVLGHTPGIPVPAQPGSKEFSQAIFNPPAGHLFDPASGTFKPHAAYWEAEAMISPGLQHANGLFKQAMGYEHFKDQKDWGFFEGAAAGGAVAYGVGVAASAGMAIASGAAVGAAVAGAVLAAPVLIGAAAVAAVVGLACWIF